MNRTSIICIALVSLPLGVCAQEIADSPDLFSLTFAPGPFSDNTLLSSSVSDATETLVDEIAEEPSGDRLFDAIGEVERLIIEEEALNGPQSRVLIGHFRSLAALHLELGNHFVAMAAFEQARAVIRMNDGLHSLEQAEVVEKMIERLDAAGGFSESDALQDELLELTKRNESDPRVSSILATVAERQMDVVKAYLDDDIWPRAREQLQAIEGSGWEPNTPKTGRQRALTELAVIADRYDFAIEGSLAGDNFELGDSLDSRVEIAEIYELVDTANDFLEVGVLPRYDRGSLTWDQESPMADREFAVAALHRARRLYSAAMQAAYQQGSQSEYWALDEQFVETYYFEKANPELSSDTYVQHAVVLESILRARVADRLTRGGSAVEVARALVELADAFTNLRALEQYQDAYDFLVREDVLTEAIAELFYPDVPAIRSAFGPEDSVDFDPFHVYRGYIDVYVETGQYGQTKDVEIQNTSPSTSRGIERRLRKHVSQTQFRPRFEDGRPLSSDQFTLRYYYDYDVLE